jgi:MYXO-CTERM domain-containing protein
MTKWLRHRGFVLFASFAFAASLTDRVSAITFTGSSGTLSASAEFTVVGGDLHIHLVNTSSTPVGSNPDVLTGLYFDLAGSPTLTAGSIALDGSSVYVNTSHNSVVLPLGDHWAYGASTGGGKPAGYGFYGVGAAGFGIFGPSTSFTGSGGSPGGVDYGLVGVIASSPSNGFKNQGPQIQSGVDIVLHDTLASLPAVSNVLFQYGSSTLETTIPGAPEPQTALFALAGLTGLTMKRRRGSSHGRRAARRTDAR